MHNNTLKSVYIHIPFCKNICSYCDFCKNYYNEEIANNYLDTLEKEISLNYKNEMISTIYIGGGTPSALSISNLDKLFSIIKKFRFNTEYEFTFECNYEDINEDLLKKLKQNNVNRISIGLQTFNQKFEKLLNRKIDISKMKESVELAKKYFNNINVDLMYALMGETLEDVKKDIKEFIDLKVNHISTYALILEEHTILNNTKVMEINDELQNKMYYEIIKELENNGYYQYEISNFSKEGFESKHNLTYWNNENYYGFGLGASGFVKNVRYTNTKNMKKYLQGKYIFEKEELDKGELMDDEIMLGLRKTHGIDKDHFKDKYGSYLEENYNVTNLFENDVLQEDEKNIYINKDYLFVSNEVIADVLNSKTE